MKLGNMKFKDLMSFEYAYYYHTLRNYYSLMKMLKQQQPIKLMNDLKLKEPSYLHRAEWRVDGEGVAD